MNQIIKAQTLTKKSFALFGDVVECEGAEDIGMNEGTFHRFNDLAKIDLGTDILAHTAVSIAQCKIIKTLPLQLKIMERHSKGSQAFIPFFSDPFYVVVAPKGAFNAEQICVFKSNGKQGINYAMGVWHMPIIADEIGKQFLVIDRKGPGNNCEEIDLTDLNITIADEGDTQ